jgi:hypothetical protein
MLDWVVVGGAIGISFTIGSALAPYVVEVVGSFAAIGLIWLIWHIWNPWGPAVLLFISTPLPGFLFYLGFPSCRDRKGLWGVITLGPIGLGLLLLACSAPFYLSLTIAWLGFGSLIGKWLAWSVGEIDKEIQHQRWRRKQKKILKLRNSQHGEETKGVALDLD